jgi:hypothetical protein
MSLKTALLGLAMLAVLHESRPASGASVTYTFDYTSTLNQILTSPSTGSGVFTEIGQATFSDPTLSAQFTATGTFSDSGLNAEFDTFSFRLYQDSKLVGLSTALFSGEAHLTPTPHHNISVDRLLRRQCCLSTDRPATQRIQNNRHIRDSDRGSGKCSPRAVPCGSPYWKRNRDASKS